MQSVTTFFKEENDYLYRKGFAKGFANGFAKGLAKAEAEWETKRKHEVVESLITNFEFTDEQAAGVVKADIDYVKKVRAELSK